MDNKRHPNIIPDNIVLIHSRFDRYPINGSEVGIECEFSYESSIISETSGNGKLSLLATGIEAKSKEKAFEVECSFLGFYHCDESDHNMDIHEFLENFAPAHLFPYIREYISSTTSRAGLPTVILPPANIMVLIGNKLQGKVKKDDIKANLGEEKE